MKRLGLRQTDTGNRRHNTKVTRQRAMDSDDDEVAQLRARFVTQVPAIRVTTDPFAVPARLGRKGLTDVIAHLLGPAASKAGRSYDFLVYEQPGQRARGAAPEGHGQPAVEGRGALLRGPRGRSPDRGRRGQNL